METAGKDEISDLARSVNAMLEDLSSSHRTIQEGRAHLRLVMDAVPAGLLSVDEELRVQPDYSKRAARLLGSGLAGRSFLDVLGLPAGGAERGALREFLEVLLRDLVPEDSMAELNPLREILHEAQGEARWLRLQYYLIRQGRGLPNHLLVILEDVTEEKVLGARAAESEKENLYLRALAEDPELFREVLTEGRSILRRVAELGAGLEPGRGFSTQAEEIFREVHTLKGAAASFAMLSVAEGCSKVEDSLELLRREEPAAPEEVRTFKERLGFLASAFSQVGDGAARLFGEAEEERTPCLRIPAPLIAHHIRAVEEAAKEVGLEHEGVRRVRDEAVGRLRSFRSVPARKVFARSLRAVDGLARRPGKEVDFLFEGGETRIDWELGQPLNRALLHLLRNCLDHGIERPEERVGGGKPAAGRLLLRASREKGQLRMVLSDDGRGLDREGLRTAARRKQTGPGAYGEAVGTSACDGLIFEPGISMAKGVTGVLWAGRGDGRRFSHDQRRARGRRARRVVAWGGYPLHSDRSHGALTARFSPAFGSPRGALRRSLLPDKP